LINLPFIIIHLDQDNQMLFGIKHTNTKNDILKFKKGNIMKEIYKYGLLLILTASMTMATNLTSTQLVYESNGSEDLITLIIDGELSGNEDWIGIYRPGSSNDWSNVIAWSWVDGGLAYFTPDQLTEQVTDEWTIRLHGDFEARLFFNNSYHKEASAKFSLTNPEYPALLIEPEYTPYVQVLVNTKLSGDKDWVGLYKADDANTWGNVIAWNWVPKNGLITLDKVKKDLPLPMGDYEIRLFHHNSFNVEKKAGFILNLCYHGLRGSTSYIH